MKNFKMLSKAEMRKVAGGQDTVCLLGGNSICQLTCLSQTGSASGGCDENNNCVCSEGSGDVTKIDACKSKSDGAECIFTYNGNSYSGKCRSYMAQPLACSTLI